MPRLAKLLQHFKLPYTATACELRQAYLQKVKLVHPDVAGSKATPQDFQLLQKRYEEASGLLKQRSDDWPVHTDVAPSHPDWHQYEAAAKRTASSQSGETEQVAGLPQKTVYPVAASSFIAAFTMLVYSQRSASPTSAETSAEGSPTKAHKESIALASSGSHSSPGSTWPPLESGPWNVPAAKATVPCKGIWSPSKNSEFLDTDCFMAGRAKGHFREGIGQRRKLGKEQGGQIKVLGYEAAHQPLVRDGVEMLPVHAAAGDGHIWWLEHCGANDKCRSMLLTGDAQEDTPLHHAAAKGQEAVCRALLRLGADVDTRNETGQLAEDSAAQSGHQDVAKLLREARLSNGSNGIEDRISVSLAANMLHPDGLGAMMKPPDEVVFVGLSAQQSLRRAVNMAAGCGVCQPIPVTKAMHDANNPERISNVVRGSLQDTGYDLEEMDSDISSIGKVSTDGAEVCGLLIYESPGKVSADAPGHWTALRQDTCEASWWRLDPVRGPFRLAEGDLQELLKRYQAWRTVRISPELRGERVAKLAATQSEAVSLVYATMAKS